MYCITVYILNSPPSLTLPRGCPGSEPEQYTRKNSNLYN